MGKLKNRETNSEHKYYSSQYLCLYVTIRNIEQIRIKLLLMIVVSRFRFSTILTLGDIPTSDNILTLDNMHHVPDAYLRNSNSLQLPISLRQIDMQQLCQILDQLSHRQEFCGLICKSQQLIAITREVMCFRPGKQSHICY